MAGPAGTQVVAGVGYHAMIRLYAIRIVAMQGLIAFCTAAEVNVHQAGELQLLKAARQANDATVAHCRQAANQVDTLLHAVRGDPRRTRCQAPGPAASRGPARLRPGPMHRAWGRGKPAYTAHLIVAGLASA